MQPPHILPAVANLEARAHLSPFQVPHTHFGTAMVLFGMFRVFVSLFVLQFLRLFFQKMHLRYVYPPPKLFEAQERKTVAAAKIGLLTLCPPLEVGPNQENKARFLAIKTAQARSLTVLLYLDI